MTQQLIHYTFTQPITKRLRFAASEDYIEIKMRMIMTRPILKLMLIVLSLPVALAGCGGNNTSSQSPADTTKVAVSTSDSASIKHNNVSIATSTDKGADLIVKNDCRNCHREREKLVGPAFSDVSGKYTASDIDSLAIKIIKGGSGHWGDSAMSQHPSLSMDDAKVIVKFILTIK